MRRVLAPIGFALSLASCAVGSSAESRLPPAPAPAATPILAAATTTPVVSSWPPIPHSARRAHVVRVVDGDTIVLTGIDVGSTYANGTPGHRARLIGVDTPEIYGRTGCFGSQASAFTKRELAARDVFVDFDVGVVDRYGRALVYVWKTDGAFFNGLIAREGFALQLTVPPNVRYADLFGRYVREAREARRGLWSAC